MTFIYRLNWPKGQFSTKSLKRCCAKRVLKLDVWYKSFDNVKWGVANRHTLYEEMKYFSAGQTFVICDLKIYFYCQP